MTVRVFVDTNVFLYALDDADLKKQDQAREWRAELWQRKCGRVSIQVLQEFYANVIRKWPSALEEAKSEIRDLRAWRPLSIDAGLLEDAWKIQDRYHLSFWDALIVAAAKSLGCQYLLTEDLKHRQDLNGITVVNPFLSRPETLLA